jgi:hypothetical protein
VILVVSLSTKKIIGHRYLKESWYMVAVFIPVGPGPLEIERLGDLLESIKAIEPALTDLLLIDDAPRPRDLDKRAQEKGF